MSRSGTRYAYSHYNVLYTPRKAHQCPQVFTWPNADQSSWKWNASACALLFLKRVASLIGSTTALWLGKDTVVITLNLLGLNKTHPRMPLQVWIGARQGLHWPIILGFWGAPKLGCALMFQRVFSRPVHLVTTLTPIMAPQRDSHNLCSSLF